MFEILTFFGLPLALVLIMTGVGLSLEWQNIRDVITQPKGFIVGVIAQLLILPAVALAVITLFQLSGDMAIGLFLLALCPSGSTSNIYSYIARGDVGLSVTLNATSSIITPFTLPILAAWAITYYSQSTELLSFSITQTSFKLAAMTLLPVVVGMLIRYRWQSLAVAVVPHINKLSTVVLAALILSICLALGEKIITYIIDSGTVAAFLNIVTMCIGYGLGKYLLTRESQVRTLCLEVGIQNGTLALFITTYVLGSIEMSIIPSVYSLFMYLSASVYSQVVRQRPAIN